MQMLRKSVMACAAMLILCAGCQSDHAGTVADAPDMAAAGSFAVHPAAPRRRVDESPGVLLPGWAGTGIVAALDDDDREKSLQAENRAYTAPIGQKQTWANPDTGHAGTIVPVRDGYSATGAYYRTFAQTLTVDGRQYAGLDTASQQPDGSWAVVAGR
ncbi:MAG: hypothetical protein KGI37_03955 [Alphaproteobacteria bacterium]|nr:hypothetical protein [Alphaproteobacteria bacterium]